MRLRALGITLSNYAECNKINPMLSESARVIRSDGRRVELELQRASACGNCEMNQGCGTGALGRLLGKRSRPLVIESDRHYQPGDEVEVVLPESSLVQASLLVYGLPLAGMLVAGLLASATSDSEWLVAIASLCGFTAGYLFATRRASALEARGMTPHIRGMRTTPAQR